MLDFLTNLFNTSDFPPRWHCGRWTSGHGWLHILSDLGIWSAYYTIPFILVYFAYRRRDVPFRTVFWLFGAFILACGTIHLVDATIFWWPAYRLLGLIKFITAVVSWATVIALVPTIPQALALRSPRQLEEEVKQRTAELARANEVCRQSEGRLREADRRKDEFLAMLSHELRNPLAPIRSGLDILAMEQDRDRGCCRREAVGWPQVVMPAFCGTTS